MSHFSQFGPYILSILVQFDPFGLLQFVFIIVTLLLSYISVAFQSNLVHFGPLGLIWSILYILVHLDHFCPIRSTLVYSSTPRSIFSNLVPLVHFSPIRSTHFIMLHMDICKYTHTLEKFFIHNNFTTNLRCQVVISSTLCMSLTSFFYPSIIICYLRFVVIIIRKSRNLKT